MKISNFSARVESKLPDLMEDRMFLLVIVGGVILLVFVALRLLGIAFKAFLPNIYVCFLSNAFRACFRL